MSRVQIEQRSRLAALAAARDVLAGETIERAARKHDARKNSTGAAVYVLKFGTPEEIERLELAAMSPEAIAEPIRARLTPQQVAEHRSTQLKLVSAEKHKAARERAIRAADLAMSGKMTLLDAVELCEIGVHTARNAYLIMKRGTPEDIELLRSGTVSIADLVQKVNANSPPEKLVATQPPTKSRRAIENLAMDKAIWEKLRTAIDAIGSLPRPADVVDVVRRNGVREKITNANIMNMYQWVEEFSNAWTQKQ